MSNARSGRKPAGKRIDLDAAHKARSEKQPPPVIVLGGQEFTLPAALPAMVAVGMARMQKDGDGEQDLSGLEDCFVGLFGEEHLDTVLSLGLEIDDLELIMDEAYGDDVGESSASESSS